MTRRTYDDWRTTEPDEDTHASERRRPHAGSDRSLGGHANQMAEFCAPGGKLERWLAGGAGVVAQPLCSPAGTPGPKGWRRVSECAREIAGTKCVECLRAEGEFAEEEWVYGPAREEWEP